jgi:hypothetical protein
MNAKERIISIRILDKQRDYPLYFKEIGVSGKTKQVYGINLENDYLPDEREVRKC